MSETFSHPLRESDKIEEQLRKMILNLELSPGLSISETEIIRRYGWGRTPLREAFQRLAEQSLLQVIPRHGIVIAGLSVFEFLELMDAMGIVIGPAASLACKRITREELDRMVEILEAGKAAAQQEDISRVAQCDFQFHSQIAQATGNRYLCRYLIQLHQSAIRFNFAAWKRDSNPMVSIDEHYQILEALQERDQLCARNSMLDHIANARQRVLGSMAVEP